MRQARLRLGKPLPERVAGSDRDGTRVTIGYDAVANRRLLADSIGR